MTKSFIPEFTFSDLSYLQGDDTVIVVTVLLGKHNLFSKTKLIPNKSLTKSADAFEKAILKDECANILRARLANLLSN